MKPRVKRRAVVQPLDKPYRFIPLTQGQNAIVDASDYDWLNQWNWCADWNLGTKSFYATRKNLRMHRFILACKDHEEGDHINCDTLDNRRNNLRKCTRAQNSRNTRIPITNSSGHKGVHWCQSRAKWESKLEYNGKRVWIGRFASLEEAARAYDQTAKEYFGEFAHLNFPN